MLANMLQIYAQQVAGLEAVSKDRFARRLDQHLRANFPDVHGKLAEHQRLAQAEALTALAASYGVDREYDVALFANVCCAIGRDRFVLMLEGWLRADLDAQGRIRSMPEVHRKLLLQLRMRCDVEAEATVR